MEPEEPLVADSTKRKLSRFFAQIEDGLDLILITTDNSILHTIIMKQNWITKTGFACSKRKTNNNNNHRRNGLYFDCATVKPLIPATRTLVVPIEDNPC